MQNILVFNMGNGGSCDLVSALNDGTNQIGISLKASGTVSSIVSNGSTSNIFTSTDFFIPSTFVNSDATITVTTNGILIATITCRANPSNSNMFVEQTSSNGFRCVLRTAGPGGEVTSFNGRTGAVIPLASDYPPSLIGAATKSIYTATISTTWTGSVAPYIKTVAISGITANDNVYIAPDYSANFSTATAQQQAWNLISKGVTVTNGITFTCFETKPTTAVPIVVEVYR